jgi:hypothetical protein
MKKDKDLELEFIIAAKKANELIAQKISEAAEKLREAVEISEQYGVPFESNVSPIDNVYTPNSFEDKYGSLDKEIIYLNNLVCGSYGGCWEHSDVC